jgi:hypothetical protein
VRSDQPQKEKEMSNSKDFRDGQQDVLIAIAEFLGQGGELNTENFEQFAETYEPKPNHYEKYSLDTLQELASTYSFMIAGGRTKLANGEILGEAYEQVLEAIEYRQSIDFCKHGVFRWGDGDVPCAACEFAD